jgi:hypothetical protein
MARLTMEKIRGEIEKNRILITNKSLVLAQKMLFLLICADDENIFFKKIQLNACDKRRPD